MDELEKVISKLDEIYYYSGIFGLIFFVLLAICFIAFWIYFKSSIEKSAQFGMDSKLAKLQGEIQKMLNDKSNQQQAIYSEKLATYQLELNKELSKISADIDYEKSNRFENKNEERKIILLFLNSYSELVYGSLDIKILDYGYSNYEEIKTRLKQINENYSKLSVLQNQIKFWSNDVELITKMHELTKVILDYSHFTQKLLGKLDTNLRWGKTMKDYFADAYEKSQTMTEFLKELADEEKKIRDENDKLYTEYWEESKPYFLNFLKANLEFMDIANKHLK